MGSDYNYCSGSTPTVTNANVPAPYTTINSVTYFTCLQGYQANGVGAAPSPYYTGNDNAQTTGTFSANATGTCDCPLFESLLRKFSNICNLFPERCHSVHTKSVSKC